MRNRGQFSRLSSDDTKLTEHQLKEARKRLNAGESARAISRDFDVHHAIVLRVLA